MSPSVLDATDAQAVTAAAAALRGGGLVVVPTDTVYGVGALPGLVGATARLFSAKGRGADVPVAVLCTSAADALSLADLSEPVVGRRARHWAEQHWPGPLTMVLPRRRDLDWNLGEPSSTIGVRVPDIAFVRALAQRVGPLAVTSANRHGSPTPATATAAAETLLDDVALVVDGGRLDARASTVVDVAAGVTLRAGPVELT